MRAELHRSSQLAQAACIQSRAPQEIGPWKSLMDEPRYLMTVLIAIKWLQLICVCLKNMVIQNKAFFFSCFFKLLFIKTGHKKKSIIIDVNWYEIFYIDILLHSIAQP